MNDNNNNNNNDNNNSNNNNKDNLENAILKVDIANSKGGFCRIPYRRLCQWQQQQHHSTTTTPPPPIATPQRPSFQGLKRLVLQHVKERQHDTETSSWHVSISYLDSEGDRILLSSDDDLAEAFATAAAASSAASASGWCHGQKSTTAPSSNTHAPTSLSAPRKRVPVLKALAIVVVVAEQPPHCRRPFGLQGGVSFPPNDQDQDASQETTTTTRRPPCPGSLCFIHGHYSCNACGRRPIIGLRFHATNRFDYDVCAACLELYRETDLQFQSQQCERDGLWQPHLRARLFAPTAQGGQQQKQQGGEETSLPWPCVSSSSSLASWWQQQQQGCGGVAGRATTTAVLQPRHHKNPPPPPHEPKKPKQELSSSCSASQTATNVATISESLPIVTATTTEVSLMTEEEEKKNKRKNDKSNDNDNGDKNHSKNSPSSPPTAHEFSTRGSSSSSSSSSSFIGTPATSSTTFPQQLMQVLQHYMESSSSSKEKEPQADATTRFHSVMGGSRPGSMVVAWFPRGTCFVVSQPCRFVQEVLRPHATRVFCLENPNDCTWEWFLQQVQQWGFSHVSSFASDTSTSTTTSTTSTPALNYFFHQQFQRDCPALLQRMKPVGKWTDTKEEEEEDGNGKLPPKAVDVSWTRDDSGLPTQTKEKQEKAAASIQTATTTMVRSLGEVQGQPQDKLGLGLGVRQDKDAAVVVATTTLGEGSGGEEPKAHVSNSDVTAERSNNTVTLATTTSVDSGHSGQPHDNRDKENEETTRLSVKAKSTVSSYTSPCHGDGGQDDDDDGRECRQTCLDRVYLVLLVRILVAVFLGAIFFLITLPVSKTKTQKETHDFDRKKTVLGDRDGMGQDKDKNDQEKKKKEKETTELVTTPQSCTSTPGGGGGGNVSKTCFREEELHRKERANTRHDSDEWEEEEETQASSVPEKVEDLSTTPRPLGWRSRREENDSNDDDDDDDDDEGKESSTFVPTRRNKAKLYATACQNGGSMVPDWNPSRNAGIHSVLLQCRRNNDHPYRYYSPQEPHIGNVLFEQLLHWFQPSYVAASGASERHQVVQEILRHWKSQDPPGRLLVQTFHDKDNLGMWMELGDGYAQQLIRRLLQQQGRQACATFQSSSSLSLSSSSSWTTAASGSQVSPKQGEKEEYNQKGQEWQSCYSTSKFSFLSAPPKTENPSQESCSIPPLAHDSLPWCKTTKTRRRRSKVSCATDRTIKTTLAVSSDNGDGNNNNNDNDSETNRGEKMPEPDGSFSPSSNNNRSDGTVRNLAEVNWVDSVARERTSDTAVKHHQDTESTNVFFQAKDDKANGTTSTCSVCSNYRSNSKVNSKKMQRQVSFSSSSSSSASSSMCSRPCCSSSSSSLSSIDHKGTAELSMTTTATMKTRTRTNREVESDSLIRDVNLETWRESTMSSPPPPSPYLSRRCCTPRQRHSYPEDDNDNDNDPLWNESRRVDNYSCSERLLESVDPMSTHHQDETGDTTTVTAEDANSPGCSSARRRRRRKIMICPVGAMLGAEPHVMDLQQDDDGNVHCRFTGFTVPKCHFWNMAKHSWWNKTTVPMLLPTRQEEPPVVSSKPTRRRKTPPPPLLTDVAKQLSMSSLNTAEEDVEIHSLSSISNVSTSVEEEEEEEETEEEEEEDDEEGETEEEEEEEDDDEEETEEEEEEDEEVSGAGFPEKTQDKHFSSSSSSYCHGITWPKCSAVAGKRCREYNDSDDDESLPLHESPLHFQGHDCSSPKMFSTGHSSSWKLEQGVCRSAHNKSIETEQGGDEEAKVYRGFSSAASTSSSEATTTVGYPNHNAGVVDSGNPLYPNSSLGAGGTTMTSSSKSRTCLRNAPAIHYPAIPERQREIEEAGHPANPLRGTEHHMAHGGHTSRESRWWLSPECGASPFGLGDQTESSSTWRDPTIPLADEEDEDDEDEEDEKKKKKKRRERELVGCFPQMPFWNPDHPIDKQECATCNGNTETQESADPIVVGVLVESNDLLHEEEEEEEDEGNEEEQEGDNDDYGDATSPLVLPTAVATIVEESTLDEEADGDWQVLHTENWMADATQLLGSVIFESDMSLSNPTLVDPETPDDTALVGSHSVSPTLQEVVAKPHIDDENDGEDIGSELTVSMAHVPTVAQTKWDQELTQLWQMGFTNEAKCIQALRQVEVRCLAMGSANPITLDEVVQYLVDEEKEGRMEVERQGE